MNFNKLVLTLAALAMFGTAGAQRLMTPGQIRAQKENGPVFLKNDELARCHSFLPSPPDTLDARFYADWVSYCKAKPLRDTWRGKMAAEDATMLAPDMAKQFSGAFGLEISPEKTPQIYLLLRRSITDADSAASIVKKQYWRKRPYAQFGDHTLFPEDEERLLVNSSFPSGHSTTGWLLSLILAEINPERQDTILARGYVYGQNRIISGYHYQTDVDAGRLVAAAAVARLHGNDEFMKQLYRAKAEFARLTGKLYFDPKLYKMITGETFKMKKPKK